MPIVSELLTELGLPARDPGPPYPASPRRFPDGAAARVEIPEVETPDVFREVLAAADRSGTPVHRVSQGTGITLLSDDELRQMAALGVERGIEVFLFVGARATHDIGAQAYSRRGAGVGLRLRGADGLAHGLEDVLRAVDCGVRGILAADEGLIVIIQQLRRQRRLPDDLRVKSSAALTVVNPQVSRLFEQIGVDSINLATDLSIGMIAAIRQSVTVPLDVYVEAPPDLGGFARYHDLPDLVRCAAPVYLKFGLKNEVSTDPWGEHLRAVALDQARERVRRARLGLDLLRRHGVEGIVNP